MQYSFRAKWRQMKKMHIKHEMKPIQKEAVWEGVLRADSEWAYADQGSFKMKLRDMKKNWSKQSMTSRSPHEQKI